MEESASYFDCICFDGAFTPAMRNALRNRRLALELSFEQLGEFLNIKAGTLRKWEQGEVLHCQSKYLARLQVFLSGGYDQQLSQLLLQSRNYATLSGALPPQIANIFKKLQELYDCNRQKRPGLCPQIIQDMNTAIQQLGSEMLQSGIRLRQAMGLEQKSGGGHSNYLP